MSIGWFTDKKQPPTETDVLAAIGSRLPLWESLLQFVRETYATEEDFTYLYGKNYGWARRFRVRGKLLTSFYPTQNGFTVQVNLSPEAVEAIQQMDVGENVRQAICRAHPYPEGRWLFVPIESADDCDDVHQLLALRAAMILPKGKRVS